MDSESECSGNNTHSGTDVDNEANNLTTEHPQNSMQSNTDTSNDDDECTYGNEYQSPLSSDFEIDFHVIIFKKNYLVGFKKILLVAIPQMNCSKSLEQIMITIFHYVQNLFCPHLRSKY